MHPPNYKDGSLINLMSSLGSALGAKMTYKPLKILPPHELKDSTNIVLMVIDGLGYDYIKTDGQGSTFEKHMNGPIHSLFPSVTSAAIPLFLTGLDPQEHQITGWHMFLKEFGSVINSLPYQLKVSHFPLEHIKDISLVFNLKPFFNRIKVQSYVITYEDIVDSALSIATAGKAKRHGYKTLKGYFANIKKILKKNKKKTFIYAYWPKYDSIAHHHGLKSKQLHGHFKQLDKGLESFLKSIKGTHTTVIVTSDHGMIDVPRSRRIDVNKHPVLAETLAVPLCGDFRYAYCYVKPDKTKQFEQYVRTTLKHCCTLHKSTDLVKKKYFGLFKPSKRFLDRIGDYTLIMKDNYAIYDFLPHEKRKYHIAVR
mgnify:CR=1 FL=1